MTQETKRDIAERVLLDKIPEIKPYAPKESKIVERHKDGTFGVSNLAFALYSNGHNLRGTSSNHPYGLVYNDDESIFSIGYFRKESDPPDSIGYLFFCSPRGGRSIEKIKDLTAKVLDDPQFPCKGVYLRFLSLRQYLELLKEGFLPIKENPWHPEAPEEDETYTNSIVTLSDLITPLPSKETRVNPIPGGSRSLRRKVRDAHNRFRNFLDRTTLNYELRGLQESDLSYAHFIVDKHFEMLRRKGKDIGSTPEDHLNSLDPELLNLEGVKAYIGFLQGKPVSIFVGEKLSKDRFGLYTSITLREIKVAEELSLNDDESIGFTAMPTYSFIQLFCKLQEEGIKEVNLGGSETPDLNKFKRQLGCRSDPSYWGVKLE